MRANKETDHRCQLCYVLCLIVVVVFKLTFKYSKHISDFCNQPPFDGLHYTQNASEASQNKMLFLLSHEKLLWMWGGN